MATRLRPSGPRALARASVHRLATRARRAHYLDGRLAAAERLPGRLRHLTGLDDAAARGSRRLELGSGERPTPGYIHADTDRWARHVELVIGGDGRIPVPDGWAEEILAIHVLEHIHPRVVVDAVREWRRCLRPGGVLRVHVPDSRVLCERFATEPDMARRWALMGALNGMYANADVRGPGELSQPADHQIYFDADILRWVLTEAGFERVDDLTGRETDVHTEGWSSLVDNLSLIFAAR